MKDRKLIKKPLPDGNDFLIPEDMGFETDEIEKEINEIYSHDHSHFYESYYPIEEGMTVVDAGAYTGLFTLKASKKVGSEGKVIALEPYPPSFKVLKLNVEQNGCENVHLINEGLSNTDSTKRMKVGDWNIGASILRTNKDEDLKKNPLKSIFQRLISFYRLATSREILKANFTTLDHLIDRLGIEKIDYLKMDIEGHEVDALNSYTKFSDGDVVIVETHRNLEEVLYMLCKKGFSIDNIHITPINESNSIIHSKF
ncbi:hypothetical protein AKJ65_06625 [candidate division MSBL1 archaeon SCGC-AAA259E19]|uniref:Methyltransferase FkbM domain-containing protein n=1 Tax=candidate division MSBL1 archaeon SCGC-AAA259E19 TaxID=1698264 RepID=A0A133UG86_9EURY|nr:hypothetical protein AKJ65_06625 [candidate division MSBL1 archaeon SCGC-AAA259E19]